MFEFGSANEEQKKAIMTTDGPVLIIAGPGTGKTYTLVKRISYLIFEKGVTPSSIMAVTFTEKAAKELLTRISDEFLKIDENCKININEMYIGTFHSVCLRLLKEHSEEISGNQQSRMLDAFEQVYLVCQNMEKFRYLHGFKEHIPQHLGVWRQAEEICRYVNQMMEELVDVEKMADDIDKDMRFLGKLVMRYRELLEKQNVMDFSSIQTDIWNLFSENEEVCKAVHDKIHYVMVDEYQDTNYIQEQLVFKIIGDRKNICVVGDDDQGMYRFRGATIRNILEFPNKFEKNECQIIHLNGNYRSEPGIIIFYNRWMENAAGINLFNWDKYRYPKQIQAKKSNVRPGSSVYFCGGDSIDTEKKELLEMIQRLQANGNISNLNQIAFLFKSVKSKEAVETAEYLETNGIPVYSPRSDMFFERKEVKQILGCLMFCFIGTYRDVVQTGLLTVEEYAASTNETLADVKKRIEVAKVICEFLEYLKLPEQYHIAREFQVYSLFQEMMPPLRQLDDIEKQQLKTITFNNVMMKAMPDQRKFIRDIKGLIKNGTYDSYFEEQQKWASVIKEKFEMTGIHSKDDIDKFAEENKVIAEELQLSMQKALIRSRSQLLKNKPAENISKSIALLTEVDARLFAKMDMEEKENLKAELDEVTRIVKNFKRMLSR